jgi:hypothetical protein
LKFSFTTAALSISVRFDLDSAGRRKAPTALTRVPFAAIFMLMYPAPGTIGPFTSSRMGMPISRDASIKAGAVG